VSYAVMRYLAVVFVLASASVTTAMGAADPPLCRDTNFINRQFVPTAEIAQAIYRAIGHGLARDFLKRYPIVVADDKGDHWSMSQTNSEPPPKVGVGTVVVSAGGGQLSMDIDKCSGAVTNASFNR
jgi:hypothetical protein